MAIQAVTIGDDGTVLQSVMKLPADTEIGGSAVVALGTITSTSATAFSVGRQGATNPVFNVNANAATVVTGLNLVGAAAAAGMAVAVTSSGTDESLTVDAKGAGSVTVNGTATGNVILGNGVITKSIQALSGAGAIGVTTFATKVTSTGANALTLANGTDGQLKAIVMVVDGGDATLTPTTKTGYTTIVFSAVGQSVLLQYYTTLGWMIISNNGAAAA